MALGLISALLLLLNVFTPGIAAKYLERKTGFETKTEAFSLEPFSHTVHFENITLSNPDNIFPDPGVVW